MASKIEILRAVAVAVGASPPSDENEDTDFIRAMSPLWDQVVSDFSTRHAWTWGTQTREADANSETPPAPWTYSYNLPVDHTLVRDVRDDSGGVLDYDIQGQRVFCDYAGPIQILINVAEDPSVWPGDFAACVRTTLEGMAWKGMRDEYDRGEQLITQVDPPRGSGRLQKAISRNKRQKPPGRHMQGSVYQAYRNSLIRRRSNG